MDIKSTSPLSGLFRSSPFKPVQEHMRTVFSCICFLPPIMDALYRQDKAQIDEFGHNIIQLETEADNIKHTFRVNMPNTLMLPVDREDLLKLASESVDKCFSEDRIRNGFALYAELQCFLGCQFNSPQ